MRTVPAISILLPASMRGRESLVGGRVSEMTSARLRIEYRPDVVLMDYRLPGLDGVQATAAVREACPDVAVVCLTASANAREIEALYEAGAAACLTKEAREIVASLSAIIRNANLPK